jgi:di/tricarboxylate transporter
MAKKRKIVKESKEPEYEFVPPDFDEKEFILKDIYGTKITIVVSVIAVIMGIVCSFVDKAWEWYGGIILMFAVMFALGHILKLVRLDPVMLSSGSDSTGGTKGMLGNYFVYLFLCLAVWTLTINAPFI